VSRISTSRSTYVHSSLARSPASTSSNAPTWDGANSNQVRLEWNVLDWNEPALGFYRQLGAWAVDDWTVHRLSRERPAPPRTGDPDVPS